MIFTDTVTTGLVRRISALAEDVAGRPVIGPYEVGVLEELLVQLRRITGLDE